MKIIVTMTAEVPEDTAFDPKLGKSNALGNVSRLIRQLLSDRHEERMRLLSSQGVPHADYQVRCVEQDIEMVKRLLSNMTIEVKD